LRHRIRRYGWLLVVALVLLTVWVLNASRVGTRVEGCPEGCAAHRQRREEPLRVLSLNMLHGFPRFQHLQQRLDLIAEEIGRLDADIVCLQEVPWTPHLGGAAQYLGEATGLNHIYLRANGNRWTILFEEGEAILSRYPLRDVAFAELRPQAGFFEHRVVLGATAVTPHGEIRIFVTHVTNGAPQVNRGQVESLMDFVAGSGEDIAILAGDFNAAEDSRQIQALSKLAMDAYRALHPGDDGFTCCVDDLSSDASEPLEERIDYAFLLFPQQDLATVVSCEPVLNQPFQVDGGWQWVSDHVGLLRVVSLDE